MVQECAPETLSKKNTEWFHFSWDRKSSPQILQRIMDNIFQDLKGKGVEIYMDDIVIYSSNIEEYDRFLEKSWEN